MPGHDAGVAESGNAAASRAVDPLGLSGFKSLPRRHYFYQMGKIES